MTKDIDQIIEKAKSEAQKDAVRDFFVKNRKKIIIASTAFTLIIISSIILFLIKSNQQKYYSEILHKSFIAQELADYKETKILLKKIIDARFAPRKIKSLAVLKYSSLILEDKKNNEAFDLYLSVADCNSCDHFIRELSQLYATKLWFMDEILQKDNQSFKKSIEIYAFRAKFLQNHLIEQLALIEKYEGNIQKSYDLFTKILNNENASSGVKVRAQTNLSELDSVIKKDTKDDV